VGGSGSRVRGEGGGGGEGWGERDVGVEWLRWTD